MNMKLLPVLLTLAALTGCAGPSPYITPVESRTSAPIAQPPAGTLVPAEPANGVSVVPVYDAPNFRPSDTFNEAPAHPSGIESMPQVDQNSSSAVVALLGDARQAVGRGDLSGAESQVERALRISPRDPQVYLQLAAIKRQQGEYLQAEQVALRGVAVSAALPDYKRLLWSEIAKIRTLAGNKAGATAAQSEAARY